MTPRRKRLLAVLGILVGVGAAAALAMLAFEDNLLYFYNPSQVLAGDAPDGRTFRIGGMVTAGSLERTDGTLQVRFVRKDGTAISVHAPYMGVNAKRVDEFLNAVGGIA